jgi:predicted acylesterase/phospholipase RssA
MAINFPDSPALFQSYSIGNRAWRYDGEKWTLIYASVNIDGGLASSTYGGVPAIDGGSA